MFTLCCIIMFFNELHAYRNKQTNKKLKNPNMAWTIVAIKISRLDPMFDHRNVGQ